jgi:hypothetical protein
MVGGHISGLGLLLLFEQPPGDKWSEEVAAFGGYSQHKHHLVFLIDRDLFLLMFSAAATAAEKA